MTILELKDVSKHYISGTRTHAALVGVTMRVEAGEMLAIMGPSGAGKSTLLQICAGLLAPSTGTVLVDGHDLYAYSRDKRAEFRRRHMSTVFQNCNLIPMLTARENIVLPALIEGISPPEITLAELAPALGIADRLDHFPTELSGGEQQRVAIARALINNPRCIFADEPTGNLDRKTTHDVMELFCQLNRAGRTVVIVTHDPEVAGYCHRVLHVMDGTVSR